MSFPSHNLAIGSAALRASELPAQEHSPSWFAAYTTPRHEKTVTRQLESRSIESFLPLYKSIRRWKNGCRVEIEQPLFPGYVFVRVPRRDSVKVLQLPGVLSIVSSGRKPAALSTTDIEALRSALPHHLFEPHPYLAVGHRVRIITGPLTGLIGVVVRKKSGLRVVLSLDLIQQSVAVEIDLDEIEPVKS